MVNSTKQIEENNNNTLFLIYANERVHLRAIIRLHYLPVCVYLCYGDESIHINLQTSPSHVRRVSNIRTTKVPAYPVLFQFPVFNLYN